MSAKPLAQVMLSTAKNPEKDKKQKTWILRYAQNGIEKTQNNKDSKLEKDDAGRIILRIRQLHAYICESYFSYLAGLDGLVVCMDALHRYRVDAGFTAITDLKLLMRCHAK